MVSGRRSKSIRSYRDLGVWQKAILAAKMVYTLVKRLPREELFALSSQMRRAVISIASNIAAGQARNSTKEFLQFLSIAKGSKAELETQLILCVEIKYFSSDDIAPIMALLTEIGKMLNSLIASLTPKPFKSHVTQPTAFNQQYIPTGTQPIPNTIQHTTYSYYQTFQPVTPFQPPFPDTSNQPQTTTQYPPLPTN